MKNGMPEDPAMLMSFVNMKLRDYYSTLDELCDDMGVERKELEERLAAGGFTYNAAAGKFW